MRRYVNRLRQMWMPPVIAAEFVRERIGGNPVAGDREHLESVLDWLERAQDATGTGGVARGYSLTWSPVFRGPGWQAAYPETTGYIIPTWLACARLLGRERLAERALRAAHWESDIQLPSGAVRAGTVEDPESPAIFNTGQVSFGWLAAFEQTRESRFAECARAAGYFLVDALDDDGIWRRGTSRFTTPSARLYNARTAWALAEAGVRLGERPFADAARAALHAVAGRQRENGWLPECCLDDPARPLLHTLAYAARGLVEGSRVLTDDVLLAAARRMAEPLARTVRQDGSMPGRLDSEWRPAVPWSCLTGQAQMANVWIRLFHATGEEHWLEPVPVVLRFLKHSQNRHTWHEGLRGGVRGSWPMSGAYGPMQVLNWAAKYVADGLLRWMELQRDRSAVADWVLA